MITILAPKEATFQSRCVAHFGAKNRSGVLPRAHALGYCMPPLRGSFCSFNRLSAKETLLSQSDRRLSGERASKVSIRRLPPTEKALSPAACVKRTSLVITHRTPDGQIDLAAIALLREALGSIECRDIVDCGSSLNSQGASRQGVGSCCLPATTLPGFEPAATRLRLVLRVFESCFVTNLTA